MNTAQLSAYFNAHRTAILGTGAAAVAGAALYQRKKTAGAAAGGTTAGASVPGTIPAAAVVPASGSGTYDTGDYGAYQSLQDEINKLADAQQTSAAGSGITSAPAPISTTLFAPSGTASSYIRYGNGTVAEVESDGSVFGIAPGQQWDHSKPIVNVPWYGAEAGGPVYNDTVHALAAAGAHPNQVQGA